MYWILVVQSRNFDFVQTNVSIKHAAHVYTMWIFTLHSLLSLGAPSADVNLYHLFVDSKFSSLVTPESSSEIASVIPRIIDSAMGILFYKDLQWNLSCANIQHTLLCSFQYLAGVLEAETMSHNSNAHRKKTFCQWVSKTRKKVSQEQNIRISCEYCRYWLDWLDSAPQSLQSFIEWFYADGVDFTQGDMPSQCMPFQRLCISFLFAS